MSLAVYRAIVGKFAHRYGASEALVRSLLKECGAASPAHVTTDVARVVDGKLKAIEDGILASMGTIWTRR